jgi:hypothetical protein
LMAWSHPAPLPAAAGLCATAHRTLPSPDTAWADPHGLPHLYPPSWPCVVPISLLLDWCRLLPRATLPLARERAPDPQSPARRRGSICGGAGEHLLLFLPSL